MKTSLSLLCIAVLLTASNVADAQFPCATCPPGASGLGMGGPGQIGQSQFRQVSGDVQAGLPGRFWFETNLADQGLGYNGSYLTLGSKTRLFEDFLDGRWLAEARLHHSIDEDEGDFFGNFGIERVFSIPAAKADVSLGAWYDYNGQTDAFFSHDLHQVGISGKIKTARWDLLANGYFPIGTTDFTLGDVTGVIPFAINRVVLTPAIDSAQQGFDTTLRFRPKQLAFANGNIDLGGYGYKSDLVDFYGGGRVRLGFQALRGAYVNAEVNYDDRFKTTGLLTLGWTFGANGGYGGEYGGLGRDLEKTVRNDHIVRATNEAAFAINPDTGLPYNVVHVDNERAFGSGDGSFENPYSTLAEAETNSAEGDLIFVDEGDRSDRNYNTGIALKNDQQLRGTGSNQLIEIQGGQLFSLSNDPNLNAPILSNNGGSEVVLLANNNTVAGVNIDGTAAGAGIRGNGVTNGQIDATTVQNSAGSGVDLSDILGDWRFTNNTFTGNTLKGMKIENALDPTSNFLIQGNTATNNGTDGIRLENFDPASIIIDANSTSNNAANGLVIQNFINNNDIALSITNHSSDANAGGGIVLDGGRGQLNIFAPTITNNSGTGIEIRNWASTDPNQYTVISGLAGTPANLTNNGVGGGNLNIVLDRPGLTQNVLVTNTNIDGSGGVGLRAFARGIDTVMNITVRDDVSVTNNTGDGLQFIARDSAIMNANVGNPDLTTPRLQITNNAVNGGNGITVIADGIAGQPAAQVNANIQNVSIINDKSNVFTTTDDTFIFYVTNGILVQSLNNAVVDVNVTDSDIGAPALSNTLDTIDGIVGEFDNDGNGLTNNLSLERLNIIVGNSSTGASGSLGTGVLVTTNDDTQTNISIIDSIIRPNGTQGTEPGPNPGLFDNGVFGDAIGNEGIVIIANGAATDLGTFYFAGPGNTGVAQSEGGGFQDIVSDGVEDNLTRVTLLNNTIRDFTFDGVDISTFGDAQLVLQMAGNTIFNNGAGLQNDTDNDGIYDELNADGGAPNITHLLFYDGVNIDAFEDSTISARITNNQFEDNFERGLSINTFQRATINALVQGNGFLGNDRGTESDFLVPPVVNDQANRGPILGLAGSLDLEAINNEEYYFRIHESLVYVQNGAIMGGPGDNDLIDPLNPGVDPAMGAPGVFIPGNVGVDIFGNPVPFGTADLNLAIVDNGFQLGTDIQDFSVPPGEFTLAAEGANAGIFGFGTVATSASLVETLISNEELLFIGRGVGSAASH